ncbi:hypothetical protein OOU_Y34scaffold00420g4 [Pyricularia oryzae Y34]|uniref:Uncharacterized protein n=3 Tax=Pyricularia oryzae TaxID=318829 RepID=H2DQR4_PYROR|nr:hypothetical protein 7bg7.17 [Pyricularia oryzae]ELQ40549.1 hypothetical protein OOU_Y34scaffold00420g4 [Pyricularia oryzae Y34]
MQVPYLPTLSGTSYCRDKRTISQFVALAVLGGTALAQSPTGNNDAGLAARDVNGDKVLSRRDSRGAYHPTGPSQPPQPIWTQALPREPLTHFRAINKKAVPSSRTPPGSPDAGRSKNGQGPSKADLGSRAEISIETALLSVDNRICEKPGSIQIQSTGHQVFLLPKPNDNAGGFSRIRPSYPSAEPLKSQAQP